jgi:DNA-directed RNA polymerase alpha subunit
MMGPIIQKWYGEGTNEKDKGAFRITGFKNSALATAFASTLRTSLQNHLTCRQFYRVKITLMENGKKVHRMFHEYGVIPGVKESVQKLIDNLSKVQFVFDTATAEENFFHELESQGMGPVTYRSISDRCDQIVKDQADNPIFTIEDPGIQILLEIESRSASWNMEHNEDYPENWLKIPRRLPMIRKVGFDIHVELNELGTQDFVVQLYLETDGSITPTDALIEARRAIYEEHRNFDCILEEWIDEFPSTRNSDSVSPKPAPAQLVEQYTPVLANPTDSRDIQKSSGTSSLQETKLDSDSTSIDELEISARAYNSLKRAQINTVKDLLDYSQTDLLQIRNFGIKSANEVVEALHNQLGISLPD